MAADANLTVTSRVDDQASGALKQSADAALKLAAAELKAAQKLEDASEKTTKAKKAQVSASKQVALALKQQASASDPLRSKLVQLERVYEELRVKMIASRKAGEKIPPSMVAAANAAKRAANQIKAQIRAQNSAASSSPNLTAQLKGMAAGYLALTTLIPRVTGAIKTLIAEQIALGDTLAKQSVRLGVSVEALQEYRFAAESGGVSAGKMDAAIGKLSKAVGEAAAGNKVYSDAFEGLGVSITDAQGRFKTVEELLPEIADGLANTADQGIKAANASKLFGRTGIDLITVLGDGADGLETMQERFRELNGGMSTAAALARQDAAQALGELDVAVDGLQASMSDGLIPGVTSLVLALTDAVAWVNSGTIAIGAMKEAAVAATGPIGEVAAAILNVARAAGEEGEVMLDLDLIGREVEKQLQQQARARAARARARAAATAKRKKEETEAAKAVAAAWKLAAQAEEADLARLSAKWNQAAATRATALEAAAARGVAAATREYQTRLQLDQQLADFRAQQEQEQTAAAEVKSKERIDLAVNAGTQIGQTFVALAEASQESNEAMGKAIAKTMIGLTKQAIDMALEFISLEAAKASAAAVTAHAGIPFAGLGIGLAAAGAIASAILGLATFAEGGLVTGGTAGRDSVPALLTPGEFVLPVAAVRVLSQAMRTTPTATGGGQSPIHFQDGGRVPAIAGGTGGINLSLTFQSVERVSDAQAERLARDTILPAINRLQRMGIN